MHKPKLIVYWCRRDFRLTDNQALTNAVTKANSTKTPFLPLFIIDSGLLNADNNWNIGYPRRLFLSRVLSHFAYNFSNLPIVIGDYKEVFEQLSEQYEVEVFANDDVEPYSIKRDAEVATIVTKLNLYTDQITVNKEVTSGSGNFYSVFSPFKRAVWQQFIEAETLPKVTNIPATLEIQGCKLKLIPYQASESDLQKVIFETIDQPWRVDLPNGEGFGLDQLHPRPQYLEWNHTETKSLENFDYYLACGKMANYKKNRDDMGMDTVDGGQTSRMSVALKWGLVSSRTLKSKILNHFQTDFVNPLSTQHNEGAVAYLSELIWREFYKYILYHRPEVLDLEFQVKFQNTIEWVDNNTAMHRFKRWILGQTGYPAVDAAMNQIAQTGWMHNRSRMMVASILTKNLGVDWRWGQAYFRAVLLDLDEASNNGGWQWASSTGSDPKPIRIFNPHLQANNYDSKGLYQKKYLPDNYVASLRPIIEHKLAREQALARYNLGESKGVRDY
jgi:deoxyribodipyrimidine photo-lyase